MADRPLELSSMRQVLLHPDKEDGGWVAEVPSLPGCISGGATPEEALRNIRDAMESWIDAAQASGMEVPAEDFGARLLVVDAA